MTTRFLDLRAVTERVPRYRGHLPNGIDDLCRQTKPVGRYSGDVSHWIACDKHNRVRSHIRLCRRWRRAADRRLPHSHGWRCDARYWTYWVTVGVGCRRARQALQLVDRVEREV